MSPFELSVLCFLQIVVILTVCRVVGWLTSFIGQPQVVGEMIAGVMLGPSLFGWLAPGAQAALFPAASKPILYTASQLGLVLYMFLVGLEFDIRLVRSRMKCAGAVSLSGIIAPFMLGCALAYMVMGNRGFFSPKVLPLEAMFFTGAAMSITAFPMLARIVHERGLTGTSLGTLALAAGSLDDGAAWCVLALVLTSFSGDPAIALLAIGGGTLYFIVTLTAGSRAFKYLGRIAERQGVGSSLLTVTLILVMAGAWFTDRIGIYAVFGAFIMGVAMPKGIFAMEVQRQIEPVTVNLLLPLFFVYSGLNTRITLIDRPELILIALVVLAAACMGKGVACWGAALITGEENRTALGIGALMNARGLMELIILNIGLERGVITPLFFTVMVLMAILTTLMATPVFKWVYGDRKEAPIPMAMASSSPG